MKYFTEDIEKATLDNNFFRKVIFTGTHLQLVLMSLKPGEDIGLEVHKVDQFFRIEKGSSKFIMGEKEVIAKADHVVIVPAGMKHNVINTGKADLKLYTVYAPPNHPDGTIHKTKSDAIESEK